MRDTGEGIPLDKLPYIFERMYRVDQSRSTGEGESGLGLAIVRHLVEIHGGSVLAESSGPDQGATFVVRLPVVSSRTRQSSKGSLKDAGNIDRQQVPPLNGLHVLVVDDDEDTLEMMMAALGEAHARVTAALSVEEAITRIKESRPDVIVSDIAMPVHDGYELISKVRALDSTAPPIPAVAMTAYARQEDRERALLAGYQDYLPKPVEPVELIAVLARVAARAGKVACRGRRPG